MRKKPLKPVFRDRWVVECPDRLRRRMGAYVGMLVPAKDEEREFSEALKEYSNEPPYLVWDGNVLQIFTDLEEARKACTGSISIIFRTHVIVENDHKQVSWTETKERTFEA